MCCLVATYFTFQLSCYWHQPPGLKINQTWWRWSTFQTPQCVKIHMFAPFPSACRTKQHIFLVFTHCQNICMSEEVCRIYSSHAGTYIWSMTAQLPGSLSLSTTWLKICPKILWWQVHQLHPQVLFSSSFLQICTAFTIIMASPEAPLELNNRCAAAEKITREQRYNGDVNMQRVNRGRADTSAWSVTPIINCQQCQCSAVFHMKVSARLTGWSPPLYTV